MRCGQSRRRDSNEAEIVKALQQLGATVIRISGKDAPDLLISHRGRWLVAEVKSARGKLTEGQQQAQYPIVRTVDDALELLREP